MHPVLTSQHARVDASHSRQTFEKTDPQALKLDRFRQHRWSQLQMIPHEDDMCMSVGKLKRHDRHGLRRLSSLVHQNELTGPWHSPSMKIASHLQSSNRNVSALGKFPALPYPPPPPRCFASARRVPVGCECKTLRRNSLSGLHR